MSKRDRYIAESPVIITDAELKPYIRYLLWLLDLAKFQSEFYRLIERISAIKRNNGPKGLVKYLKEANLASMKAIAKEKYIYAPTRVKIDHQGWPCIIPFALRKHCWGNSLAIQHPEMRRAILSVFSLYRVIDVPAKLNLNSITDPFKGVSPVIEISELHTVLRLFPIPKPLKPARLVTSVKAGPNHTVALFGSGLDSLALFQNRTQFRAFWRLAVLTKSMELLDAYLVSLAAIVIPFMIARITGWTKPLVLGKLAKKKEAAGKMRLFAIPDIWTQSILEPLHSSLFEVLRTIEQDGTFDQGKPIERLREWTRLGYPAYSFDLSSATDRLPRALQVQILCCFFGEEVAKAWGILFERDWYLKDQAYTYAVGQAMGALSSWAMLAITHHLIVQLAAYRAGYVGWFQRYALLGDDLVIADESVAAQYLIIMGHLGVDISEHKSLISGGGVLEFAKRLVSPTREFSPIGPKNLVLGIRNWNSLLGVFVDLHNKGFKFTIGYLTTLFQHIPATVNDGRRRRVLLALCGPGGLITTDVFPTIYKMERWLHSMNLSKFISFSPLYLIGFARYLALENVKLLEQTGKDMEIMKSWTYDVFTIGRYPPIKYVGIIGKLFSCLDLVYVLKMIWPSMLSKAYLILLKSLNGIVSSYSPARALIVEKIREDYLKLHNVCSYERPLSFKEGTSPSYLPFLKLWGFDSISKHHPSHFSILVFHKIILEKTVEVRTSSGFLSAGEKARRRLSMVSDFLSQIEKCTAPFRDLDKDLYWSPSYALDLYYRTTALVPYAPTSVAVLTVAEIKSWKLPLWGNHGGPRA